MGHIIQRLMDNPFMVSVLVIAFTLSMLAFRRRVKRESSPDHKRPQKTEQ